MECDIDDRLPRERGFNRIQEIEVSTRSPIEADDETESTGLMLVGSTVRHAQILISPKALKTAMIALRSSVSISA